jgi:MinD-like ATPase involved in chromosome partitioning or flagellar assembly
MLVTVCADKGSPGATTAALALAAAWTTPAVVVEADPYGGDLAIRLRTSTGAALPEAPTVLTLATAARSSQDPDLVFRYAQRLNDQLSVVPGHLVAEQMSGVREWGPLASSLARTSTPVVADIGRAHTGSPLLPVAAAAQVLVVVARADAAAVIRLRERLVRLIPAVASLRGGPLRVCPVLVTPARHGAADAQDVGRILRESAAGALVSSVGFLAMDAGAVSRLEAGEDPGGRLARTALLRSARALARQLRDEERVAAVVGMAG